MVPTGSLKKELVCQFICLKDTIVYSVIVKYFWFVKKVFDTILFSNSLNVRYWEKKWHVFTLHFGLY